MLVIFKVSRPMDLVTSADIYKTSWR